MVFTSGTAVFITLLAAAMWGSWFQSLNHIKGYPISGFVLWLYTTSLFLVWGVTLVLKPFVLPQGILQALNGKWVTAIFVAVCGAFMAIGLHLQLSIMGKIGMILSTAISGAIGSIFGVAVTILISGLPKNISIGLVAVSTLLLVGASYICTFASKMCSKDNGAKSKKAKVNPKIILLLIISNFLVTGYPIGLSVGTATETNLAGLPPLLCVAFLATGSFIGVAISCGISITLKKQWKLVLHPGSKKPFISGIISGIFHYGGNILSIFAAPILSPAISFLFGRTANMWTYFWGILYGEFKGAHKKTIFVLMCGISGYIAGIVLLALGMYR